MSENVIKEREIMVRKLNEEVKGEVKLRARKDEKGRERERGGNDVQCKTKAR